MLATGMGPRGREEMRAAPLLPALHPGHPSPGMRYRVTTIFRVCTSGPACRRYQ